MSVIEDGNRQVTDKALMEVFRRMEPLIRAMLASVKFNSDGFIRFNFDNEGGYLDITANATDADGYGVRISDESGDNGTLIEAEQAVTLQHADGRQQVIVNDGFSGVTVQATGGGPVTIETLADGGGGGGDINLAPGSDLVAKLNTGSLFEVLNHSLAAVLKTNEASGVTTGTFDGGSP